LQNSQPVLYVDTELHERVEEAAIVAGVKIAPWLHAMVRQISMTDFPASWEEERSAEQSHDSRVYDTRFMLRLDKTSQAKLQQLISHFGVSKATVIRQLIIQATPEDFPTSWQIRAHACGARQARQESAHADQEPRSHNTPRWLIAFLTLVGPPAYPRADSQNRVGTWCRTIGPPDSPIRSQAM
jgi:hypothetical protein